MAHHNHFAFGLNVTPQPPIGTRLGLNISPDPLTQLGLTAIMGLCGHCKREDETYLIPVIDYQKPGWD